MINSYDSDYNEFAEENEGVDLYTEGMRYALVDKELKNYESQESIEKRDISEENKVGGDSQEVDINDSSSSHKSQVNISDVKPASSGNQAPPSPPIDKSLLKKVKEKQKDNVIPNAPIFSNEKMKLVKKEVIRKGRVPEPPALDEEKLKVVKDKIENKKTTQRNIPVPPPVSLTMMKNAQEIVESKKKPSNPTPTAKSAQIMSQERIDSFKSKLEQSRTNNQEEATNESTTIQQRLKELSPEKPGAQVKVNDNRAFSFDDESDVQIQQEVYQNLVQNADSHPPVYKDYKPFPPSKAHIMVEEDENIEESEEKPKQVFSPKFSAEDRELNQRDDSFEGQKINRILIANIETLEKELAKSNERISYLEEYNSKLTKARNELYEEKENLIKRSIEFDYIKQKLDEKEKRLQEAERENAKHTSEIYSIKRDNEDMRHQMESMVQFIKKLATTRSSAQNPEDAEGKNEEFVDAINAFADSLKRNPDHSREHISPQSYMLQSNDSREHSHNVSADRDMSYEVNASPPQHKIIKKKSKPKTKRKVKKHRVPGPQSPLSREQIKLLHDPNSFERYARELDLNAVRNVQKKNKSSKRSAAKSSRNKASPL